VLDPWSTFLNASEDRDEELISRLDAEPKSRWLALVLLAPLVPPRSR
jgi:hypothetical protein